MKRVLILVCAAVFMFSQTGCMTAARQFDRDSVGHDIFSPQNDILVLPWSFGMGVGACALLPAFPVTAPVSQWLSESEEEKSFLQILGEPFYLNLLVGDMVGFVCAAPFWPVFAFVEVCDWIGIFDWDTKESFRDDPPVSGPGAPPPNLQNPDTAPAAASKSQNGQARSADSGNTQSEQPPLPDPIEETPDTEPK